MIGRGLFDCVYILLLFSLIYKCIFLCIYIYMHLEVKSKFYGCIFFYSSTKNRDRYNDWVAYNLIKWSLNQSPKSVTKNGHYVRSLIKSLKSVTKSGVVPGGSKSVSNSVSDFSLNCGRWISVAILVTRISDLFLVGISVTKSVSDRFWWYSHRIFGL